MGKHAASQSTYERIEAALAHGGVMYVGEKARYSVLCQTMFYNDYGRLIRITDGFLGVFGDTPVYVDASLAPHMLEMRGEDGSLYTTELEDE